MKTLYQKIISWMERNRMKLFLFCDFLLFSCELLFFHSNDMSYSKITTNVNLFYSGEAAFLPDLFFCCPLNQMSFQNITHLHIFLFETSAFFDITINQEENCDKPLNSPFELRNFHIHF